MNASSASRALRFGSSVTLAVCSWLGASKAAHADVACPVSTIGQYCTNGQYLDDSDASAPGADGTCVLATVTQNGAIASTGDAGLEDGPGQTFVTVDDGGSTVPGTTYYGACVALSDTYCDPATAGEACSETATCRAITVDRPGPTVLTSYSYGLCNGPAPQPIDGFYEGNAPTGGIGCSVARTSTMSESTNAVALVAGVALVLQRRRRKPGASSVKRV